MTRLTRLQLITSLILTIGLGSAIVIYLTAPPPPGDIPGYDPQETKQYLREMERYGGKANVLASELTQWFNSLWHGKRLAVTVASITVLTAATYLVAATPLPSDLEAELSRGGKDGRPRSP
jgi:hypothetical protein